MMYVVIQMIIYKSCRVDFGYNDTVCENLIDDFPDENTEIQNEVSIIHYNQKKLDHLTLFTSTIIYHVSVDHQYKLCYC